MKLIEYRKAKWMDASNIFLDAEVLLDSFDDFIPITVVKDHPDEHIRNIYSTILSNGDIEPFTPTVVEELPSFETTLEFEKLSKLKKIAEDRYFCEVGGVAYEGIVLPTDRNTRNSLLELLNYLVDGQTVSFKISDNAFINLSNTDAKKYLDVITKHVNSCFAQEELLLLAVQNATSLADLEKISYVCQN